MPKYKKYPTEPGKKTCTGCLKMKPLEDFYKNKNVPDGRTSRCGECLRKAQAQRYKDDPETQREYGRQWYSNNQQRHYQKTLAWKRANPEKHRKYTYESQERKKNNETE